MRWSLRRPGFIASNSTPTVQAEHLAKLGSQVRLARDKIAALRAEWASLQDPARVQELAKRFLRLQPVDPHQFDSFDNLPDRAPDFMQPGSKDPIGGMIEHLEEPVTVTGTVPPRNSFTTPHAGPSEPAPARERIPHAAPVIAPPAVRALPPVPDQSVSGAAIQ